MAEGTEKLMELLKSFDNVMLVTNGVKGMFDARPMHIAKIEDNGEIWFLSGSDDKITELKKNPQALIVAQDKKDCWLSIAGTVQVSTDQQRLKSLWKEPYKVWFPKGVDDPNIRLLGFKPDLGEYWDERGTNKIEYALKAAKAYATGETPKLDKSTHETVKM